jgi:single-stranded-DNA-specific exonuclease
VAGIKADQPITGRDVAFRIAPHINAPGRLGSPDLALRLLMARDVETARGLAAELSQVSSRRRELSTEMESQAIIDVRSGGFEDDPALVIGREGWSPGVVGIVAGRLSSHFARPVIVVGFDGAVGRGSVRGPAGARLHDALVECSGVLLKFGGHQRAAGVEVRSDRLGDLRESFVRAIANQGALPGPDPRDGTLELDVLDDPAGVLADLDRLEPCGEGNPRPRLLVRGRVSSARAVKNGHLKLTLDLGRDRRLGCFAIDEGARAPQLVGDVTLVGDLRHNTFPGADPVELFAEQILQRDDAAPSGGRAVPAASPGCT